MRSVYVCMCVRQPRSSYVKNTVESKSGGAKVRQRQLFGRLYR